MRRVVYESAELRVVAIRLHRSRSAVVTFSSYVHHRTLDRPGFGEAFLLKYGIDAVHVICRGNEWFQYADIRPALEVAAREIGGYESRVAYGLSMGGYAAINFSDWLGVNRSIAIAPQYSIDPGRMPLETRWLSDRHRIAFVHDRIDCLADTAPPAFVIHDDKFPLDCAHVAKIAESVPVTAIPIPYSGHPPDRVLVEAGLLSPLVRRLIEGDFDAAAFARELAVRAPGTPAYHYNRAAALPAAKTRDRLRLIRQAAALAPGNPVYQWHLSEALSKAGRHNEALAIMRRVLAKLPDHPDALDAFSRTLERARRLPEAIEAAGRAVASASEAAARRERLATLLARRGRLAEAETQLRLALSLDPGSPAAPRLLSQVLGRLGRKIEALEQARLATSRDAGNPAAHEQLAKVLLALGNPVEAATALAEAERIQPGDPARLRRLILLRLRCGDVPAAIAELRRAAGFAPVRRRQRPARPGRLRESSLRLFRRS
jgi:tetratricopeptide (TPR) repeat protein